MRARGLLSLLFSLSACQMEGVSGPPHEGPLVASVEPSEVQAGGTVRLIGEGFHMDPEQNLVTIGGVRAHVQRASEWTLDVQVPPCLLTRVLPVTVSVDGLVSPGTPLRIHEGPAPAPLAVGDDRFVSVLNGSECLKLPGGATYLAVVQSSGSVAGARYGFSLLGLSAAVAPPPSPAATARLGSAGLDPELAWHGALRRLEAAAFTGGRLGGEGIAFPSSRSARPGGSPPDVGEERRFRVLDASGRLQEARAVARLVGRRVAIYVDLEAPAGGLTEADLSALAASFDEQAYPVVSGVFGGASDIDQNERVIVLLTPAVNRLTPAAAEGFVGGFFFGVDLLPEVPDSNAGEILYALVPDPEGRFGSPRSSPQVRSVLPPILAHELQHLVHFQQRMRLSGAQRNEAVWLSEALAQSAETLIADTLESRGRPVEAALYRDPTLRRARDFLSDPGAVSVVITAGQGSLAERGAGWLFLQYALQHYGGSSLLTALTRSTLTGSDNLESFTGQGWGRLLSDWSLANYLDGMPAFPTGRFQYPATDLRGALTAGGQPFPLNPRRVGVDFEIQGGLLTSSTQYFLVTAAAPGALAIRLASPRGGAPAPEARFVLHVVRIQ